MWLSVSAGFVSLSIDDRMMMTQASLYPICLLFHSQYYNERTGSGNWFINTPRERDLVIEHFPHFAGLGKHFVDSGRILRQLELDLAEYGYLTALAPFCCVSKYC